MKGTKVNAAGRTLLMSIVSLLLCAAMLAGTTFAWFTDTVNNTGNRIQAGNLKIDLLMDKGAGYESIADGHGDIFKEANKATNSNITLWEPGKTQFAKLAVENKGNLAVKYTAYIDVIDNGLVGSLECALVSSKAPVTELPGSWEEVKAFVGPENVKDVESGRTIISTGVLDEIVHTPSVNNERDYVLLAVHMKEDAHNAYKGKDIIIDINIVAAQKNVEEDAFGKDYDKTATGSVPAETSYTMQEGPEWFKTLTNNTDPAVKKKDITEIIFTKNIPTGIDAEDGVDLTDIQSGKVKGYLVENGDEGTYKIYVAGDYIYGNQNCQQMFADFSGLTNLDLTCFYTSNVTNMLGMFKGCGALTNLDFSNFDTSNVTNMAAMFNGCGALTNLDLSNFDTSNVTNMQGMFWKCEGLTTLDLSCFDTSKVQDVSSMFKECKQLTTLDLSKFDTSAVTTMANMFESCTNLEKIKFGSNFNTSDVKTMVSMFSSCEKLETLDLRSFNTSKVEKMSTMFKKCKQLTILDLSSFDTSSVSDMNGMFHSCEKLETLDLHSFNTSSVANMQSMFFGCSKLKNLNLSSNFSTLKVTTMNAMFSGCNSIENLDLSNFYTTEVMYITSMFENCQNLSELDIRNFDISKVDDSSNKDKVFELCGKTGTEITINEDQYDNFRELLPVNAWTYNNNGVFIKK